MPSDVVLSLSGVALFAWSLLSVTALWRGWSERRVWLFVGGFASMSGAAVAAGVLFAMVLGALP